MKEKVRKPTQIHIYSYIKRGIERFVFLLTFLFKWRTRSRFPICKTTANLKHLYLKIFWIVRAFWLVYKCVFMALWSTKMTWQYGWLCLQVVRSYSFVKEIKVYIRASYIVFLGFVKTENNCYKRNKRCSLCIHSQVKTLAKFVRIREQVNTLDCVLGFTDLLSNSPKRSPRFSPGYECTENMFYFLNLSQNF